MDKSMFDKLVILEMANNHMGDVGHGIDIIHAFHHAVRDFPFRFVIKFQYRDLDSLIHPDYRQRMDLKYIKRFSETRLSEEDFLAMKREAEACGFLTLCTPFDEPSVDKLEKHGFPFIKVASCSFTDWPLLERVAQTGKPVIASTAGAALTDIDNVVTFFEHRSIPLCLMHCVGAYPTPDDDLELNQIDFFRQRYPDLSVGFSTHENPDLCEAAIIAVAKGAAVLERHVGLPTAKYALNAYSSTPEQIVRWLQAMLRAYRVCGVVGRRREISGQERDDLRGLQRGLYAARTIAPGTRLSPEDTFFALPNTPGQIIANDCSKYKIITAKTAFGARAPINVGQVDVTNIRGQVLDIVRRLCRLIKDANLRLQDKLDLEISHHYGLEQFDRFGCSIITCVNREYCKKIILLLPGQENPVHWHQKKEETFHVLFGELRLAIGDEEKTYRAGDIIVVERDRKHRFSSPTGAVFEEISTTHYLNDSFYEDCAIAEPARRKTYMTFYTSWLTEDVQ